jgi:hypothetical protein
MHTCTYTETYVHMHTHAYTEQQKREAANDTVVPEEDPVEKKVPREKIIGKLRGPDGPIIFSDDYNVTGNDPKCKLYVCMYVCMYVCVCVYVYVCVYV